MAAHLLESKRRLLAAIALSALAGFVAAGANVGAIGLLPPQLKSGELHVSGAVAHVIVDSPSPSLLQRRALPRDVATLVKHTELIARVMASPPVVERIARRAGVPPEQTAGVGRMTAFVPSALTEPGSEQRANEIAWSRHRYRFEVQANPTAPLLEIYALAPSTPEAVRIADAAAAGLNDHLRALAGQQGVAPDGLLRLRPLGAARGGVVNGGASLAVGGLTFLTVFTIVLTALLGLLLVCRRPGNADPGPRPETSPVATTGASPSAGPAPAARLRSLQARLQERRSGAEAGGDWPRTTRVLPWLLAVFIGVLWLVPFNSIELNASLPVDLKFDRLVLPFVVGAWVLALVIGGRFAPRIRLTWIHAMVALFLACAFLSVVLNGRSLSQSLELDLSLKKLPLIVSYVSLFVIVASAVRRSEVAAFLRYTLVLATILAVGMIWEYRFKQNLFYDWSEALLPGMFTVIQDSPDAVDHLGRRLVRGSAGVPLEAVTMLSLALPIALVGLLRSERRGNILYALAACVLVAAMFETYRKSALLAPVAVVVTLVYFRRRELLKLAPLGMVLIVVVSILSPGAIGSTVAQFTRADRATVPTVSDRTSDYDAVRPDVWSHLAFGRGWGSYSHVEYRILDSEILYRTIEMGVVGLAAFLLVILSVVAVSRATIAARHPVSAPPALVGAAAAIAFLIATSLYDVMSFPHGPYIFLYLAGLVAIAIQPRRDEDEDEDEDSVTSVRADHTGRVRGRPYASAPRAGAPVALRGVSRPR